MTDAKTEAPLTGLALLRSPFAAHHISKLPKPTKQQTEAVKADYKKGIRCRECGSWHHPDVVHLDYVGHAALTDRLLDTDPTWSWEPVAFRDGLPAFDSNGGLWIKLTICGVTRLGYGHAAAKPGADPGAREKEVIGDALRNAAMRFGAALDLWHKGDLHGPDEEAGKPSSEGGGAKEPTLNDRADLFLGALNKVTSRVDLEAAWAKGSKVCAALSTADPDKLDTITRRYEARRAEFIAADKPAADDSFPGDTPFDQQEAA
ncbi:hypothetical protein HNP32_003459 [Brevundimonas bullata]|uniref:Uncharacterized protein n=1 Tax=Brevundimonas bullata TaxID=13160 RepID=A0A7W7N5S6_9CAUL|nr:hypothetical protein [Brevundimonas bullata]MBB4799699.1 hypothetical protein [Brevundimonas bullata]MBB6384679.1 hypothetical protein [Brevundimonas bullata]